MAAAGAVRSSFAASDFWNRKQPGEWTAQEIDQLRTHSPWAKEVNAEFESDLDYAANPQQNPGIGRGGATPQIELGRNRDGQPRGSRRREPVTVRWESAQPMIDAAGVPLPAEMRERYVISVSGLPLGVMERPRRGDGPSADPEENTPAARRRRMIEQLQASATLAARGKDAAQPGVVMAAPRAVSTYLFGFSKDLVPLSAADREVEFTLRTAFMAVKTKFEPKEMSYRGTVAL